MKSQIFMAIFVIASQLAFAQKEPVIGKTDQKGKLYVYWGWNRGWYNTSDIGFRGTDYDFDLENVVAKDRQTTFSLNSYLNPTLITIPQYNFKIGYFIGKNYDISFGVDHMKYVVPYGQSVKISGYIAGTGTIYDGIYENDDIIIEKEFLSFEHTDGLNYLNVEFRRFDNIFDLNQVRINLTEGFGMGALMPKTNARLLNNERHDDFHLAGFGIDAVAGINLTFYKVFFIQSELKGGYINMPDIRTTRNKADRASQSFFFSQLNIVFGVTINMVQKTTIESSDNL
jgi:hypothetical protein